jgi:hypothetical protein
MEIEILTRSNQRKEAILSMATLYAYHLKIAKSKTKLFIFTMPNLVKKEGYNGIVSRNDDGSILMGLDSRISATQLSLTLAHEMVHVKQMVKGQYKLTVGKRGKVQHYWLGQKCNKSYYDQPWEREAFGKERLLANEVMRIINSKLVCPLKFDN